VSTTSLKLGRVRGKLAPPSCKEPIESVFSEQAGEAGRDVRSDAGSGRVADGRTPAEEVPMAARSFSGGALVLVGLVIAACGRGGEDGGWTTAATAGVGSELKPSWTVDVGGGAAMDFVLVPAGNFTMSSDDGLTDPPPSRRVVIAKPFYLARYETTQAQWQAVMGTNPSRFTGPKNPVENVSWDDCRRFLAKLNARSQGGKFGLPTDEQWEYACRAGSTTKWSSGDAESGVEQCAWFAKDSGQTTHPVGEKKPNAWGLYDMHGNVWEWCDDAPPGECGDGPSAGGAPDRIFRGGSWYFTAAGARSGSRAWGDAARLRQPTVGFRVAMNLAR
jgi:formylglycine-generating enzyme required for sulfatase activity